MTSVSHYLATYIGFEQSQVYCLTHTYTHMHLYFYLYEDTEWHNAFLRPMSNLDLKTKS